MTNEASSPFPGNPPVLSVPLASSPYDRWAWLYDLIVGSWPYHRLAWGTSPRVHEQFAREALLQSREGVLLDAGCGSLLFTARAYREVLPPGAKLTLLDASSGMLTRGRRRLGVWGASAPVSFEQGDISCLPFAPGSVHRLFHFGVLHCLNHPESALAEFRRVLQPTGELWLSSLVLARPVGDRYLARLHQAGHVGVPRSAGEVLALVRDQGLCVEKHWTAGSLLFLRAVPKPPFRAPEGRDPREAQRA